MQAATQRGVILVTGATGFVGSHLVDRVLARGERVRILMRGTSNLRWIEGKPVERARADLSDRAALREAVRGARMVLHFGGRISARTEGDFIEANAAGTENLARAFLDDAPDDTDRLFLYCSSLAAGGPARDATRVPLPHVREDDPPRPVSAYGQSKLEGERRLMAVLAGRTRVVILRPPAVFGPRDRGILKILRNVQQGWILDPTKPGALFSLISVGSLVEATVLALDSPAARGVYYLSDGSPLTWQDIGYLAARILGVRVRVIRFPIPLTLLITAGLETIARMTGRAPLLSLDKIRELRQSCWVCVPEKARREFGFVPSADLEGSFEETIRWYRGEGWLRSE